jgi:microcystin-dependent protein
MTDPDIHEPKGVSTAPSGSVYVADGAGSGEWIIPETIDPEDVAIPVGTIVQYAGNTAPDGWLLCYGQEISRTTYSELFSAIGETFGAGNGSTTFNIPDCRGRIIAGKDDMGGVPASRLSTNISGDVIGATGGEQTHQLTTTESPELLGETSVDGSHTHTINGATNLFVYVTSGGLGTSNATRDRRGVNMSINSGGAHTHSVTVNATSTSLAHNNTQPGLIFNTIIYAGV